MDFIRHKGGAQITSDEHGQVPNYTARDNLLMNNLDICNQSKSSLDHPDKMTALSPISVPNHSLPSTHVKQSFGSDSVFEENENTGLGQTNPILPVYSSTCKQLPQSKGETNLTTQSTGDKQKTNESLSSSFESEALDIVASLKSANALKAQLRHGKFPTDVDPITGSPRQPPIRLSSDEKLRLIEGLNPSRSHQHAHPSSNKSSCLSSPNGSNPSVLQHHSGVTHRSPAHSQVS